MIFDEMEKSLWNQDWVLCCAIHVYPSHQKMWDDSNTWRISKFQIHPGKLGVVQCFFVVFYTYLETHLKTQIMVQWMFFL